MPHTDEFDLDAERSAQIGAGCTLGGKYRLISEIGRGGMGSVWRAEHLGWEAPVAIKIVSREEQPEALARFEREVRLAASLRSPHVVQVLDHGIDEATRKPFIAMELLEGETLAQRIERYRRLSPAETFHIVSQLTRALSRAHAAGIVHRDLKPENVFLVRNDEEMVVKVLDFGVAKWTAPAIPRAGVTRPGSIVGTPFYMSPEQIQGALDIDHRADLWSLSAIVCECLTGKRPFEAKDFAQLAVLLLGQQGRRPPSALGPVPPGFDAWFARACHANIEARFQSARDLAQHLAPLCGVAPSALEIPSPTEELPAAAGPASMSPVSHTAAALSPLARPALWRWWRRPAARFVMATLASFAVASGALGYWYRDLWLAPPHVQASGEAAVTSSATRVLASTPMTAPSVEGSSTPSSAANSATLAAPGIRPFPQEAAAPPEPEPEPASPPPREAGAASSGSASAPSPSLAARAPRGSTSTARKRGKARSTPSKKSAGSDSAGAGPAHELDVNGRRIRTSLVPTP